MKEELDEKNIHFQNSLSQELQHNLVEILSTHVDVVSCSGFVGLLFQCPICV